MEKETFGVLVPEGVHKSEYEIEKNMMNILHLYSFSKQLQRVYCLL